MRRMTGRVALLAALLAFLPLAAMAGEPPVSSMDDPLVPDKNANWTDHVAEQVIRPGHNLEVVRCEPFECALMTLGHRQGWRDVQWRKDINVALADAKRLDKPIAVIMMLNEYNQNDAGFN